MSRDNKANSWNTIPRQMRDALRTAVFERDSGICQIALSDCTGVAEVVDHVIPRALGGKLTDLENLRASCASCNQRRQMVEGDVNEPGSPKWRAEHPSAGVHKHEERSELCMCGKGPFYPSRHW